MIQVHGDSSRPCMEEFCEKAHTALSHLQIQRSPYQNSNTFFTEKEQAILKCLCSRKGPSRQSNPWGVEGGEEQNERHHTSRFPTIVQRCRPDKRALA